MGIIKTQFNRQWLDSSGCFTFGKYGPPNAQSVEDIAREDPSYLRWIVENVEDISEEDREIIFQHIRFRRAR